MIKADNNEDVAAGTSWKDGRSYPIRSYHRYFVSGKVTCKIGLADDFVQICI